MRCIGRFLFGILLEKEGMPMCTAMSWKGFFGRTLDLEYSYEEQVTVMPRNFPLPFRVQGTVESHHAIMGTAYVAEGYPLFYDGMNERGLAMAGLNFPNNTCYHPAAPGRDNVAPFEFIPWILGQCATVDEVEVLLQRVNLADISFSGKLPLTPQHWMIADRNRSIVVESTAEGVQVYEDPMGVLTNNPPFPRLRAALSEYEYLIPAEPECKGTDPSAHSRGMGAVGLPGDWSSPSRFVRAAFLREYGAGEGVSQFFHLLGGVEQPEGVVRLQNGGMVRTVYTSCCDLERGIYYYTTYENRQITGVNMHREHLDGSVLTSYPLRREEHIFMEN